MKLSWEECFLIENALKIAIDETSGSGKARYMQVLTDFRKKWKGEEDEQYQYIVVPAFPHAASVRGYVPTKCFTYERAQEVSQDMEWRTGSPWVIQQI